MLLFWSPGKEVICHSILINNYSSFEICQCPQNMLSLYDLYRKFSIKGTWCPSNGPGGVLLLFTFSTIILISLKLASKSIFRKFVHLALGVYHYLNREFPVIEFDHVLWITGIITKKC